MLKGDYMITQWLKNHALIFIRQQIKIEFARWLEEHTGYVINKNELRDVIKVCPELEKERIEEAEKELVEKKKCSSFEYIDGLEDHGTVYFALNHKDFLPAYVGYDQYDHAMDAVRDFINDFIRNFFRSKDKSMGLVEARSSSMDTRYGDECPDSRRYEFELIDIETESLRYGLVYSKGMIVSSKGNLPLLRIVAVLKSIGAWEQ